MNISIEIPASERDAVEEVAKSGDIPITISTVRRLDSVSDVVLILIPLAATTLTAISNIIIAMIAARREITVKYKGVEITGLSEKNTKNYLIELLKKDDLDDGTTPLSEENSKE